MSPDALTRMTRATAPADRRFFTGMALAIAATVVVGFAPTYYLRPQFTSAPLPLYLHVHGFVVTAWIALLLAQTVLVAARRIDVHRRLGWFGAGWAALVVVTGLIAARWSLRREVDAGFDDSALTFLTTPLFSMAVFAALMTAAVLRRRQPHTHKRLVLLATVNLLDAAIARWPLALVASGTMVYVLVDLFVAALLGYDILVRRRLEPASLWGGLLVVTGQVLRDPVGRTEAWHAFGRAFLGA